ncbi:uncharacterized protein N7498_007289 [Penicillium cinerascens]|uniref:Uncharacterized protein n=1 Tax=Penicillium cinerascens TaxID=70096 RepID=A0A9W9MF97_9EURO|nr:uncharacterized protein N7498_007289 [Penicillium cinerascens]KAJ5198172.1 hypothetical protein N7498_007289 [Penicillium cinerascens]
MERVEVVKGDPGSPLTREDLKSKVTLLSKHGKLTDMEAVHRTTERVWRLEGEQDARGFACS